MTRRRQRSQLSSASSDDNSPAMKRVATTTKSTPITEEAANNKTPTPEEIWKVLMEIQTNVSKFLAENQHLRKEMETLKESIQFTDAKPWQKKLSTKADSTSCKVIEVNESVMNLEERLTNLVYENDRLEQYTRKFNVEIIGIPEQKDENLPEIVSKLGQAMSVDIKFKDVEIVHRLYRKPPARKPIIVRFTTHRKKQEFYKGRFMLKEVNLSQIVRLEVNKAGSKIFINVNLTARRKGMMAAAWKMKKDGQFDSVLSMD